MDALCCSFLLRWKVVGVRDLFTRNQCKTR
jgi:hypothetical protein